MEVTATKATFPKYPAYKDSGVEWLGEIPEGWELRRFKYLFKEINERSTDGSETLLSVSQYTGVTKKSDKVEDGDLLTTASTLEGYKKVYQNDLVSNIMLAWNGSLGFSPFDGITSPAYSIYRLNKGNSERFFHYLVRSQIYKSEFKRNSSGVIESRLRLYTDDFFAIWSILPSPSEQTAIANFLDDKTAKIDRAIAQKEQHIALLKERKQIIIQNAVTKGLDPKVNMKDSGVEWIGEIPEHWEVKNLRYAFKFLNHRRIPLSAVERESKQGDYPYYGASGIIDYVDDFIFNEKTILIAEDGANLLSKSTPLAFVAEGKYWVNNHAHILQPKFEGFLYWAELLSLIDYTIYISGAAQPKLSRENLGAVKVIVPPRDEIIQIVSLIKTLTHKFSEAISLQQTQIEKLKEYKATLIDSAVTGKIKVTDYGK